MSEPGGERESRRWGLRRVAVVVALGAGFGLVALAVWLPLPNAESGAVAAVVDDPELEVRRTDDLVTLAPVVGGSDTTVVFYPGAGVAPDAYLAAWAPVVADAGVTVKIPSMPLRLAVLDRDAAADIRTAATRVGGEVPGSWWIGGHSLGGAMAASFVAEAPPRAWDGLVLWAAHPRGDALAERDDLEVLSVSGTRDALTTPEEVEASRADLPPDTTFVVLEGVNHAQFGSYGPQRGDGVATVDDEWARAEIAAATAAVLGD